MAVDWLTIKTDYLNGGGSYRKLAEKYGVNKDTIALRAKKENWRKEKDIHSDRIQTKTIEKTEDKISDALSEEAAAKVRIRTRLIRMAENWINDHCEVIEDTGDFRRIVQSCVDLGIMEVEASKEALDKLDSVLDQIGGVI